MQEEHKFRVALGVFDDLTRLEKILGELQAIGLDAGCTAVVADAGALGGEFQPGLADQRPELPNLLIRGNSHDDAVISIADPDDLVRTLPATSLLHFEDWITGKLSETLNGHLANGACVLIVPITSAELEWRVSNALLKHSISAVQLHDLPISDGASAPQY